MKDFDPIADAGPARPGCEPGQAALQRLLDGDPSWDSAAAARHRAECVDCREELILASTIVRLNLRDVIPAGLTDRILSRSIRAGRRRRMQRYAAVGLGLAASVVVLVVSSWPDRKDRLDTVPPVVSLPAAKTDIASVPRPLGESVEEARDAIVTLTRRTATEPRDRFSQLLPDAKLPDSLDTGAGLEPLADARTGAARSVEPIRESARRAVNFFLRAADPPDRAIPPQ